MSIIEVSIWGTSGRPWKVDMGEFGEYSINELGRIYAPTYGIAEKKMREAIACKGTCINSIYGSVHHVEMSERPMNSLHMAGDSLSTRIYDHNGRELCRREISSIPNEDGESDKFEGRDASECRFKPGDIVEVQFGDKISCWVVVDVPPTKEQAAKWGICDYTDDCYTVVQTGDYMASHEHVGCVGVFKPRYKVPEDVRAALMEAYKNITEK